MAKYRQVYCEFWKDTKVSEEMTPEDRYFMLYLLTNSHANQIGVYEISKKVMAFELGYTQESVNAVIDRFVNHHKLVKYNPETREVAVRNWGRYNFVRGGKPVLDLMNSELRKVKDISLVQWVFESYVGSAKDVEELNMPICDLFKGFFNKHFYVDSDETLNDSSSDTSDESLDDTGAISISININNNIKDLKDFVQNDAEDQDSCTKLEPISKAKQIDEIFEELWAMYPHKKGKGQVKQSHKAALSSHGKEKLVRAIKRYLDYVELQRKSGFMLQYQNGSTFFHGGYLDYLADDYVEPMVNKPSKAISGTGTGNNKFHNFEQAKQEYTAKELEDKLRMKAGGSIGARANS